MPKKNKIEEGMPTRVKNSVLSEFGLSFYELALELGVFTWRGNIFLFLFLCFCFKSPDFHTQTSPALCSDERFYCTEVNLVDPHYIYAHILILVDNYT